MGSSTAYSGQTKRTGKSRHGIQRNKLALVVGAALAAKSQPGATIAAKAAPTVARSGEHQMGSDPY